MHLHARCVGSPVDSALVLGVGRDRALNVPELQQGWVNSSSVPGDSIKKKELSKCCVVGGTRSEIWAPSVLHQTPPLANLAGLDRAKTC